VISLNLSAPFEGDRARQTPADEEVRLVVEDAVGEPFGLVQVHHPLDVLRKPFEGGEQIGEVLAGRSAVDLPATTWERSVSVTACEVNVFVAATPISDRP